MNVSSLLRSALAVLLLGLAGTLAAIAVALPAGAGSGPGEKGGVRPAEATSTTTPGGSETADPGSAHALVAAGAVLLIGTGIGAGVWRSRRDPEAAALGH